jgi:hypothetical protein
MRRFPVNAGLCSRLYHNLCNYPETTVSQLNGQRSDRRQVKASYSSLKKSDIQNLSMDVGAYVRGMVLQK